MDQLFDYFYNTARVTDLLLIFFRKPQIPKMEICFITKYFTTNELTDKLSQQFSLNISRKISAKESHSKRW